MKFKSVFNFPAAVITLAVLFTPIAGHAEIWPGFTTHLATGAGFEYESTIDFVSDRPFFNAQNWLTGDFDGDGRKDVVHISGNGHSGRARAEVNLSTDSGFETISRRYLFAGYSTRQRWLVGDFNGDGQDDLVNVYGHSGKARAWVHLSTTNDLNFTYFEYKSSFTVLAGFSDSQRWQVGDFNGDGMDDLVNVYGNSGRARAWVHLSTGSGFEYKSSFTVLAGFSGSQRWEVGDFNGDGTDDLVNVYGNSGRARAWVHLSTGSGFEYKSSYTVLAGFSDRQHWQAGDFDGDGQDDLVNVYGNSGRARAWVHLSTGSGFEYQSSFQTLGDFFTDQNYQRWLIGDFNGDDLDDLMTAEGLVVVK